MKKILLVFIFLLSLQSVFSITIGFDIDSDYVYLGETPYTPEYFTDYNFSVFIGNEFYWNTQSLLIEGGILWENNEVRPFLSELGYNVYFDSFILSIGKNNKYFGDGIKENFIFPQNLAINAWENYLWNFAVDVSLMPFLLTAGVLFDTKSLDTFKKPEWYSFYFLTEYFHRSFTLSAESDLLFTPYKDSELSSKTALQASFLLPYDISVYSNAMVQVIPTKKGINSWGTLIGVSKYTSINGVDFTTIAEFIYAGESTSKKPEYAFLQIIGWESFQTGIGLEGVSNAELVAEFTLTFQIGTLDITAGYTSGNLLLADKTKYSYFTTGVRYEKD